MNLLQTVNTEEGREVLGILGSKPKNKIVKITKNSFVESLGGDDFKATFFSGDVIEKLFQPILDKVSIAEEAHYVKDRQEAFLHYAGISPKIHKYPQIFLSTIFSPVAGAVSPCDGVTLLNVAQPGTGFSTIVANAGTAASATGASGNAILIQSATTGAGFVEIDRSIFNFDTSTLSGAKIITAVLNLYSNGTNNDFGAAPQVRLVPATPASTANLAPSDYGNISTVQLAALILSGITTSQYNGFGTTNLAAAINQSGITSLGIRFDWDANSSFAGSYSNSGSMYWNVNYADAGTNVPQLVITFTSAGGAFLFNFI